MKAKLVNESLGNFLSEEVKKKKEEKKEISFGPGVINSYKRNYTEWKDVNKQLDRYSRRPVTDKYEIQKKRDLEKKLRKLELRATEIEKGLKLNLKANYEDAKRFKKLVGASDLCTVHFD